MSFPSTPPLPPVPDTPPTPPLPPTPAPAAAKQGRRTGRSLFLLVLVPPALIITIIVVMYNMGSYGRSKLVGVIILCCLGLLVVIGAVATLLASIPDLRAAKRSGDRRAVRKQLDNLGATSTKITVTSDLDEYSIAAVIDLVQGPQPRAVASCSYAQDTVTRSQWFTGGTSYNNHFVMRFEDGTQHTFTIATSEQDISQLSGIIHPLYEGCVLHPDQTPLTIDMYVHSKTLVDARLD